ATCYYAAKFLALLLLLGVYLLLLVPFLVLILLYAGMGWLGDLGRFAGWAVVETSFVAALGLFLSASFGRRATVASSYIGFGLALLFVIGPWYIPYYLQSLPWRRHRGSSDSSTSPRDGSPRRAGNGYVRCREPF